MEADAGILSERDKYRWAERLLTACARLRPFGGCNLRSHGEMRRKWRS